ncbi:MAG: Rrf2 family transcriptional regulator [Ignavibacteria bacterium RBG_16_34_14]|nr:MAG: Rrf2 family transcriptional regulator [Ignavibacteria bacterium RBG_16_34_14]
MKFGSQEEYGLRCLLRIGKSKSLNGLTIPEISDLEGLSTANAAKLLRTLRLGGFIEAARGQSGGYKLAKPAEEIIIGDVLAVLGGRLFEEDFCSSHTGIEKICTNSIDCSIRSLWRTIQLLVDNVILKISLKDLLGNEEEVKVLVNSFVEDSSVEAKLSLPNN